MTSSWADVRKYISNYNHIAVNTNYTLGIEKPITLLLGSGVHNLIKHETCQQYESLKRLSCWNDLLNSMGVKKDFGKNLSPTLKWELLSLNYVDPSIPSEDLKAYKRERKLKKRLQEIIKHDENSIIEQALDAFEPLQTMIKHHVLSDVITLNVDLLVENVMKCNTFTTCSLSRNHDTKSTLSRHLIIKDKSNSFRVRVWHPHGDRERLESMTFGVWQYEKSSKLLKEVFSQMKREERVNGYTELSKRITTDPKNWVEIMITRPIIIIGTSLNQNEWDIWLTLIIRWRNFAKRANQKFQQPVWYLCTKEQIKNGELDHIPNGYIQKLEAPDWKTGWKWLKDIFAAPVHQLSWLN